MGTFRKDASALELCNGTVNSMTNSWRRCVISYTYIKDPVSSPYAFRSVKDELLKIYARCNNNVCATICSWWHQRMSLSEVEEEKSLESKWPYYWYQNN